MRRAPIAVSCTISALLLTTAGCGALGGGTAGAKAAGDTSVTLYSGQHEQTTRLLTAAFEQLNPGITVTVRSDSENVLAAQIEQEGAKSPADVFYAENSPALEVLREHRLLADAPGGAVTTIPETYDSPADAAGRHAWAAVSARVSALVVNDAQVPAGSAPTTVLDLADPRWKGKLALAGTETDFQPVVTSIAKAYGKDRAAQWLAAVKANAADHLVPDNETATAEVDHGQAALALVDEYYWYRQAAQDGGPDKARSHLAYFAAADPGYVLDVSGAAVLASSAHQAAADELVDFLTSERAQQIIANSDSFEYPLRPGVAANPQLPPLATLRPNPISIADLGDGALSISLLQQAQLL